MAIKSLLVNGKMCSYIVQCHAFGFVLNDVPCTVTLADVVYQAVDASYDIALHVVSVVV